MVTPSLYLTRDEFKVFGPNPELEVMDETQFFKRQHDGEDNGRLLPLPVDITVWNDGEWQGCQVFVAEKPGHLYFIAEESINRLCLIHYVSVDNSDSRWRLSFDLPSRIIAHERRNIIMSNPDIRSFAGGNPYGSATAGAFQPMSFEGAAAPAMTPQMPTTGVDADGNLDELRKNIFAVAKGYGRVVGYIMQTAPAVTMALQADKDTTATSSSVNSGGQAKNKKYVVIARESKPSKPLEVAMRIPARCIMKGNNIASPEDVGSCQVDYNGRQDNEMVNFTCPYETAASYIIRLGGFIPEYPMFTESGKKDWKIEECLGNTGDVTYVTVRATTTNKNGKEVRRFVLKTTSKTRSSLYTTKNIICLRALQHMDVSNLTTPEQVYKANLSAFGAWMTRKPPKNPDGTAAVHATLMERAIASNPPDRPLVFMTEYTIDGKQVPAPGSVYFMQGETMTVKVTDADGATVDRTIGHQTPQYTPWEKTGRKRGRGKTNAAGADAQNTDLRNVTRIVERYWREPTGEKGKRSLRTIPINWADHPDHEMFAPYATFAKFLQNEGYVRPDYLKSLNGQSSSRKKGRGPTSYAEFMEALGGTDVVKNFFEANKDQFERLQNENRLRNTLNGR